MGFVIIGNEQIHSSGISVNKVAWEPEVWEKPPGFGEVFHFDAEAEYLKIRKRRDEYRRLAVSANGSSLMTERECYYHKQTEDACRSYEELNKLPLT